MAAFEKDDDTNHHIDFVTACANLRARNYKIKEGSRHKIKIIAGKIIPAIATSTALVVGVNGMEIIKFLAKIDISKRRNSWCNLAINRIMFSTPSSAFKKKDSLPGEIDDNMGEPVKAIPPNFTVWDFQHFDSPLTLGDIIEYYKTKFDIEVNSFYVNVNFAMSIYVRYEDEEKNKLKLAMNPV